MDLPGMTRRWSSMTDIVTNEVTVHRCSSIGKPVSSALPSLPNATELWSSHNIRAHSRWPGQCKGGRFSRCDWRHGTPIGNVRRLAGIHLRGQGVLRFLVLERCKI